MYSPILCISPNIILHATLGDQQNPDGSKDLIDCGPGNDEVFLNISVEHDVAVNCEIVHAG
jgi:hypothetical protein